MILNIKSFFYLLIITTGVFVFYNGYEDLNKIDRVLVKLPDLDLEDKQNNKFDQESEIRQDKVIKKFEENNIDDYFNKVEIIVSKGETLSSILRNFNLSDKRIYNINKEIEEFFDLRFLKVNQKIFFYLNEDKDVKRIEINQNIDSILTIELNKNIVVKQIKLDKLKNNESNEFVISNSLYTDGLKNGLPQDILIKLIKLFSFDLDFQRDIKKETLVSVSYDFNYISRNNVFEYLDINYALISIEGKKIEYFKFQTDDGYLDYFNREGKNVKKSLLKTPLDGARLSSNFGMRKHPISGYNKMHKGVDFAAPIGTPIYAGGNGVVEYVGNNGGYGKYIRIRHNNEYKTAYAHLSAYKKGISKGIRVTQGDVIGYVGSTGNSTGPHLHYEIIYQNKHINPMKLKLPSGKILAGSEYDRFKKEYKAIYANHLNLLYE